MGHCVYFFFFFLLSHALARFDCSALLPSGFEARENVFIQEVYIFFPSGFT